MNTLDNFLIDMLEMKEGLARVTKDRDFYKRILTQAMLTQGGVLKVENKYAEEATNFKKPLEFGNEKICIEYEKGSLFEGAKSV